MPNVLQKLQECSVTAAEMQKELQKLEPVLNEHSAATARLVSKIAAEQEEAGRVKSVIGAQETEVKSAKGDAAIADEVKADPEEALQALQEAVDSLRALNKNDIVEIKSFPKPPDVRYSVHQSLFNAKTCPPGGIFPVI